MPAKITTPERRGIYLLTHPRSASNLFQTMLAKQPGFQNSGYKLFDAGFAALGQMQRGPLSEWDEKEREGLYDVFRQGWESLEDEVEDAGRNGKLALIKEHALLLSGPDKLFALQHPTSPTPPPLVLTSRLSPSSRHTNPTSLPDNFLLSLQPIFQIRHPALMFPSMLRVQTDALDNTSMRNPRVTATMTLQHSRVLYDWYAANAAEEMAPRVIDADDIMNDYGAVRQLCVETGLDAEAVQYEWQERSEANPMMARFLSRINGSTGIVKGLDSGGLDLEVEKGKWKGQFGEEASEELARLVGEAMADYEYLWSRRTRAKAV